jgi:predicted CoA-binding protein
MKTLVVGATPNADRFAYRAVMSLLRHGHEVVPYGRKKGAVGGLQILNAPPQNSDIHTITLYINPTHQQEYYDYFIGLNPKRIIFNPGTENAELERLAQSKGIEVVEGCTLVMLSVGQY